MGMKADRDVECGVLTINWVTRTWEIVGVGGHDNDQLDPEQVHKMLVEGQRLVNAEQLAVVVWEEAYTAPQLCFYNLDQFEKEVYAPDEQPPAGGQPEPENKATIAATEPQIGCGGKGCLDMTCPYCCESFAEPEDVAEISNEPILGE